MTDRTTTSDVYLKVQTKLDFLNDDDFLSSITMGGWLVRDRIFNGVDENQASRGWEYDETLTSGSITDLNLNTMVGIDIGGGAGNDGLGQTILIDNIVSLLIKHISGDGRLEVMPSDPANKLKWVPTLDVAGGGALKAGGAVFMHQPDADGLDVVTTDYEILRLVANGGDVTYKLYLLARH